MSDARPTHLQDLPFGAQIIVWALRRFVRRREDWAVVEKEFRGPFGPQSGQDLADQLFHCCRLIDQAAIRRVMFGPLACGRVWPDEARMIAAVSALQSGDRLTAHVNLQAFLPPAVVRLVVDRLEVVAGHVGDAGYRLSDPFAAVPCGAAEPSPPPMAAVPRVVHPGSRAIH